MVDTMNISFNPSYSVCQPISKAKTGSVQKSEEVAFTGNPFKKLAPLAIGALSVIGLVGCNGGYNSVPEQRYSGIDDTNGVRVEYCNVEQEVKDSLMKPVYEMKAALTPENDFLNGVDYVVADEFSGMDKDNPFKKYVVENESDYSMMGTSFYSDKALPKAVAVQECAHNGMEVSDGSGRLSKVPEMRFTLMHETGHHFDNYFGHDHNADFALKYDSLLTAKANSETETPYNFRTTDINERRIDVEYNWHNSLSDKKEFQKALLNDLNNLRNIPQSDRPYNIDYYTSRFNIGGEITEHDVDLANGNRAEIYATLFSYANGQDDGEKEKFIKCFSSSYEVVNKDIEKYL